MLLFYHLIIKVPKNVKTPNTRALFANLPTAIEPWDLQENINKHLVCSKNHKVKTAVERRFRDFRYRTFPAIEHFFAIPQKVS